MNILMTNVDGLILPTPTIDAGTRSDLIQVDPIHKTWIYNQSGSLSFQGYVPADFQISLQTEWGPLFPSMSVSELAGKVTNRPLGDIETIAQAFGGSTKSQALSAQAWQGPAYLQISLPIQIDALIDTKKEIIDKVVGISAFTTPTKAIGGMLVAPGPVPALAVLTNASRDTFGQDLDALNNITEDQRIYCQIGRFFRMQPCVVTSVVAAFNGQPEDLTGNPMSVDFNIELTSYFAVTREDIASWFRGSFGNPGTS